MMLKQISNLKNMFLLGFSVLAVTSCSNDDGDAIPNVEENIVELAVANTNLSTLVAALERADLVTALEGTGPFTVLAPTNAAFTSFLDQNGYLSVDDVPVETLRQLLLNHVLAVQIKNSDFVSFQSGYAKTQAAGLSTGSTMSLYFNTTQGITFNGVSEITTGGADIFAANGIIHIVDAIVTFPTVADFVLLDENFASLETAMKTQGVPDFLATLDTAAGTEPAPFTLFAPVNQGFSNIPSSTPVGELSEILSHHVITGNNLLYATFNSGVSSPATLQGDIITFSKTGNLVSLTDGAGNSGKNIIAGDLQASNGVIHAIDKVLIPNMPN